MEDYTDELSEQELGVPEPGKENEADRIAREKKEKEEKAAAAATEKRKKFLHYAAYVLAIIGFYLIIWGVWLHYKPHPTLGWVLFIAANFLVAAAIILFVSQGASISPWLLILTGLFAFGVSFAPHLSGGGGSSGFPAYSTPAPPAAAVERPFTLPPGHHEYTLKAGESSGMIYVRPGDVYQTDNGVAGQTYLFVFPDGRQFEVGDELVKLPEHPSSFSLIGGPTGALVFVEVTAKKTP